eukprot:457938-Pyramimonas_sp.AAC.1
MGMRTAYRYQPCRLTRACRRSFVVCRSLTSDWLLALAQGEHAERGGAVEAGGAADSGVVRGGDGRVVHPGQGERSGVALQQRRPGLWHLAEQGARHAPRGLAGKSAAKPKKTKNRRQGGWAPGGRERGRVHGGDQAEGDHQGGGGGAGPEAHGRRGQGGQPGGVHRGRPLRRGHVRRAAERRRRAHRRRGLQGTPPTLSP